jgi:4-hydroxy-4-methyl-2-oxoglutarate aldolase
LRETFGELAAIEDRLRRPGQFHSNGPAFPGAAMSNEPLTSGLLQAYQQLSSCIVASAIETFGVRMKNTGFTHPEVRCIFEDLPTMVGYAATARIRSAEPPMEGRSYYKRTDWWNQLQTIPEPRVVVIEDIDGNKGLGAFIGEVHATILKALGCVGLVTNGGVRDLHKVHALGFQMFAGNVSVSHAYSHVFDFGGTVEVGGMRVQPGDLLQGDTHGVQTVPASIAPLVPEVAARLLAKRKAMVACCLAPGFSVEKLRKTVEELER